MQIEQLQHEYERVQADLANGPILPSVTVDEIRSYLASITSRKSFLSMKLSKFPAASSLRRCEHRLLS
jgi:hypothetical protein